MNAKEKIELFKKWIAEDTIVIFSSEKIIEKRKQSIKTSMEEINRIEEEFGEEVEGDKNETERMKEASKRTGRTENMFC